MSDVVALLLEDDLPPARLGALLQAARKRRGLTRRMVASKIGVSNGAMRDFERGAIAIPADICLRLAECYGDDLTAHIPLRAPVQVDAGWIVAANDAQPAVTDDSESVLRSYAVLLLRLRGAQPGEPLALRADDLAALAAAVQGDPDEVEERIVRLLGCSREEAAHLRRQLVSRRVILPVAGLASGLALLVAAQAGATTDRMPIAPAPVPVEAAAPVPTEVFAPIAPDLASDLAVGLVDLAPIPAATTAPTTTLPAVDPAAPAEAPPTETLAAPLTDATVPPQLVAPDAQPPPADDDGTVGILPGEEPETIIIGDAATAP